MSSSDELSSLSPLARSRYRMGCSELLAVSATCASMQVPLAESVRHALHAFVPIYKLEEVCTQHRLALLLQCTSEVVVEMA